MLATLDSPLPASLPAGCGSAIFCYGRCSEKPEIVVGGVPHRTSAAGMAGGVYWGVVPVLPQAPGVVEIALAAGGETVPVGRIPVVEPEPPPSLGRPAPPGLIAVCMATYEPDPELFRVQLNSLRAQTDTNWVCVVSDDASSTAIDTGGDERIVVSRSDVRRGFYGNFERALRLAPAEAELIALCDQDDRWHPDKLATLRAALGGAVMAYSDQRLVAPDGTVLSATMWKGRVNNHTDIGSLLVANSITGAATLMRRAVADLALPFPDSPGLQFHDHWLGLVALAAGDIAYVARPLYDYVQHRGAVFGDVTQTRRNARRRFLRGGRAAYFLGYTGRAVQARTLLVRCAMAPGKRRALERYLAAERSPTAAAWLGLRALTRRRETLGSELELLRGIGWRHARPRHVGIPDPLAFEQRRLRRWRARI